jgi:hypothetical protein
MDDREGNCKQRGGAGSASISVVGGRSDGCGGVESELDDGRASSLPRDDAKDCCTAQRCHQSKRDEVADSRLTWMRLEDADLPAPVVEVLVPQGVEG